MPAGGLSMRPRLLLLAVLFAFTPLAFPRAAYACPS
jgi:hypothetical protein